MRDDFPLGTCRFYQSRFGRKGGSTQVVWLCGRRGVDGTKIQNQRFDCGSKLGFLQANISFALNRNDLNSDLNNWLKTII